MTREYEAARMLLARWAALPTQVEALRGERAWAQAQRTAEEEEGRADWQRLVDEIDRELAEAARLRAAVDALLDELGEPYVSLARLRYVKRQSYPQIARTLNYSVDWTRHLKSRLDRAVGNALCVEKVKGID